MTQTKRGGARKEAERKNMNSVNVQIKVPGVLAAEFKKRIREIKGEMVKTLKLNSSVFCIPSYKK
jgi:hypothetical protein